MCLLAICLSSLESVYLSLLPIFLIFFFFWVTWAVCIFWKLIPWKLLTATAKSLQSCLTLCDPIDGSPSGSTIPGILQARTLEWVAISFSNAWKWKLKVKSLSCIRLLATPWTAAYQAPPTMGFSRQGYWSGMPLPSPWKLLSLQIFFLIIKVVFASHLWNIYTLAYFCCSVAKSCLTHFHQPHGL